MLISDIDLSSIDAVQTAPLRWNEPEATWLAARDSGAIPSSLFSLYCNSNYLSFGAAPASLKDERNTLFGYYGLIMRSLMGVLVDAQEELSSYLREDAKTYDYGKQVRGETWDPSAPRRANKHFRLFILSLTSSLDLTSELIALLLPNQIPKLTVGRSDFQWVVDWLTTERSLPLLVTPQQSQAHQLDGAIRTLVIPLDSSKHWFALLQLLRNKGSHFGLDHFREMRFHDNEGKFHAFIPRVWPLLWERDINQTGSRAERPWQEIVDCLVPQEKDLFAQALLQRVLAIVDQTTIVLNEFLVQSKEWESDPNLLQQLAKNSHRYDFESFP